MGLLDNFSAIFASSPASRKARLLAQDDYLGQVQSLEGHTPSLLSSTLLGAVPGMGVAGAMGYGPTYKSQYDFVPSGFEKTGPTILENIKQGNTGAALLQGVGVVPDVAYAGGLLKSINPAFKAIDNATGVQSDAMDRGGIRVFHGSPYDFDKFDTSKIGTGEGAQAYGHGLYFAEKEDVAKAYREQLASPTLKTPAGEIFDPSSLEHLNVRVAARNNGADLDATIKRAGELLSVARTPELQGMLQRDIDKLTSLKLGGGVADNPGRIYEVDINASPEQFLDWDKPLSEQPRAVQEFLAKRDPSLWHPSSDDYDPAEMGQSIYRRFYKETYPIRDDAQSPWKSSGASSYEEALKIVGGDKSRVNKLRHFDPAYNSREMNQGGILGIKYLDQGSRGAGDGSRNYVAFSPEIIEIIRKYGLLGPTAGVGLLGQQDKQ